jgi:hypothetical protein
MSGRAGKPRGNSDAIISLSDFRRQYADALAASIAAAFNLSTSLTILQTLLSTPAIGVGQLWIVSDGSP